jgi:hypothetical protein
VRSDGAAGCEWTKAKGQKNGNGRMGSEGGEDSGAKRKIDGDFRISNDNTDALYSRLIGLSVSSTPGKQIRVIPAEQRVICMSGNVPCAALSSVSGTVLLQYQISVLGGRARDRTLAPFPHQLLRTLKERLVS